MTANPTTIVNTKKGKIEGSFENNLYVFRGIPYAAPPVGELRWMPTKEHEPWDEILPAKSYGPIAPQNVLPDDMLATGEPEPQNEDCLFLNVWTPCPDNERRPVMVWIHGGAFSMRSGSDITYRDSTLPSRGNIVLVTLNYRLGVLGFLNLNELSKGKIPSTGNEGLLDQIMALQWVKDNIEAFGGDPDNVTIFGESAGGMSVSCLMTMPKAQGLFHKAIIESPVGEIARPLDHSLNITKEFLNIVGLSADDDTALRALTTDQLLPAQQELAVRTDQGLAPAVPVADGKILPMMPLDSFKTGKAAKIPTLVGSNLEEYKLFAAMKMGPEFGRMEETALLEDIKQLVNEKDAKYLIEGYRKIRNKHNKPVTPTEISCAITTDAMFRNTVLQIAESQHKYENPVYYYIFTRESPVMNGILGACHALEIGFVFGNLDPVFTGTGPDAEKLSGQIQDAWIAFARTGSPDCESLGNWPKYTKQKETMILCKDSFVEKKAYEELHRLWDSVTTVDLSRMP